MQFSRILVAVDTSTLGTDVLGVADELARCTHAQVGLICVADVRGVGVSETSPPVQVTSAKLRADAQGLLESAARQLKHVPAPLLLIREGMPDKELIAAARDWHADLLIMGTHGRTGMAHLLKGSTAESVLHHAPCPVLTVRVGSPTS
ncbi:MAG: universal stress protein [Phycisphaerales bacterium]